MWRRWLATGVGVVGLMAGCQSQGPWLDNPVLVRPDPRACVENPVYVPHGPASYGAVFERVVSVLSDYFVIATANRYEGRITTHPRVAPGWEQFFKAGSPDHYQRSLATLQSIRQYAIVKISPADDGGFWALRLGRFPRGLLSGVTWSAATTAAETLARLEAHGLRVGEGPAWWDVDRPEDLARLRREIPRPRAPATHAALDALGWPP